MQFATTSPHEDLAALAARVYDLGPTPDADQLSAAQEVLLAANPFLNEIAQVPEGTVIDVSPIDETDPREGQTSDEHRTALALVADRLGAAAMLARRQLIADHEAEIADAQDTIKLIHSAGTGDADTTIRMRVAGRPDADLEPLLAATLTAAEARIADTEDRLTRTQAMFAQLDRDLEELTTGVEAEEPEDGDEPGDIRDDEVG